MRTIQMREALNEAMSEEMRRDPNVFLMGEHRNKELCLAWNEWHTR